MTSLFAHKVAQLTKWRFLPKNLSQLVIFVIGLAFTWSWGDKNRAQFQKMNCFKKWSYQKRLQYELKMILIFRAQILHSARVGWIVKSKFRIGTVNSKMIRDTSCNLYFLNSVQTPWFSKWLISGRQWAPLNHW